MKRLALAVCLTTAVFAATLSATGTAEAGPYRVWRPRVYRPYVYRPYVARPVIVPRYRVYYGPPAVGYYGYPGWYGPPAVSVGVGWY